MKNYWASDVTPLTLHKESSGLLPELDCDWCVTWPRAKTWVCPWWDQTLAPSHRHNGSGARCTQGPPGARRGQSWHRRPSRPVMGRSSDGVEPGHTPRPRVGRRVRMLLSFQRPSHLFGRGSFSGRARGPDGSRGGPLSIARNVRRKAGEHPRRPPPAAEDSGIWARRPPGSRWTSCRTARRVPAGAQTGRFEAAPGA